MVVACAGCITSFRPFGHTVPGPANALAAAPLGGGRIAVLAGTDDAKALFVIDERNGEVLRSFGVTKEATGVAAEAEEGPLLISVGAERDGKPVGAVEEWTLEGHKQRIVPLPIEGLGITRAVRRVAYALIGAGSVRAAVPISMPSLRVGPSVPLDADAGSLQLCGAPGAVFLLYTDGDHGWLTIRDVSSGGVAHSAASEQGATCVGDGAAVYAIGGGSLRRSISVMSIPDLSQFSSMPASRDALALYETDDHHLVSLNSANRVSSVETFRDESADFRTASNP